MSQALAARLAELLGPDVGVGKSACSGTEGLFPEERPAILRAVPKRRAEFAAGRRAARAALAEIGEPAVALPVGNHRAPIWPPGICGSISHDQGVAFAAVTRIGSLGIDLTEAAPLPGETRRAILPHASETGLDPLSERVGFSAKESLFKAIFPFVGRYFGFSAARVAPDLSSGTFRIELTETLGPFAAGTSWGGGLAVIEPNLVTALRVSADVNAAPL
ncbi:MAG: 4'-phosphopantetheinyl transferase [Pseudomonadota bacterium]